MRLEETRTVRRPIDEVFSYTADFSNIDGWDPGVTSSEQIGDGPVGEGTQFDVEVVFGGSTTPMVYEITEYDPPNRVVLVGRGEKLDAVDEISFGQIGDATRIQYTAELTFHNVMRFLVPLASPMIRKVGTRALDGLERALSR